MTAPKTIFALALVALATAPVAAQPSGAEAPAATSADASDSTAAIDEEWLNTIWTQVDDMVQSEESKLQETVTVAGVRGAEAEDEILDKLYYKGAKRYPSQDKLEKAIKTLKKAVADKPKGDNVAMQKYFIAQCYEKLGQRTEARQHYARVIEEHAESTWSKKAAQDVARLAAR